jgi:DNA-binding NarL/FixJ family response regulator
VHSRLADLAPDLAQKEQRMTPLGDPWLRLDPEQRRLLSLLGAGASLDEAAGSLGYSRRTVVRRLAEVRRALRVETNVEALIAVRQHLDLDSNQRDVT